MKNYNIIYIIIGVVTGYIVFTLTQNLFISIVSGFAIALGGKSLPIYKVIGIQFKEYPHWWKILSMVVTTLIIAYTYYINSYSHYYWLVLPIQYWIFFGSKNTNKD